MAKIQLNGKQLKINKNLSIKKLLKKYKLKIPLAFSSLPSCIIPSIITYLVATYVFAVSNLLFAILVGFLAAMSMIFLLRRADMTSLLHGIKACQNKNKSCHP